jgi:lipopolysaccharide export system protein LptA
MMSSPRPFFCRPAPTLFAPALFAAALLAAAVARPAHAEKADRSQPVNIESSRVNIDDRNKVHIFEGNVVLTQGTLTIRGDKLVVTQDADGFQKGVATADGTRLATFRQKREGANTWIEGEAERIEYDSHTERARLYNRAHVKSGGDEVSGHYLEYDAVSENYLVTNTTGSRVQVTIQPKGNAATPIPAAP